MKQVEELNPEKSDPQPHQRLLWRGDSNNLSEVAMKAIKACASEATLKADADILVKGKLALDETVLPPLLRVFAATCLPALKEALYDVTKQIQGAVVIASEEGSVKACERMVEAMKSEIAKHHWVDEGGGWQPVSALVRDALRATVVCDGAAAICAVKAAFDASPLFTLKKLKNKICRRQVPFNLHAVYEFKPSNNDVSILVEIQIHDAEVRKASAAQQRFYQIFRAVSSDKLHMVAAPHNMAHSKLMRQRSQRFMLRTAKMSSTRALKALQKFSVGKQGRRVSLLMRLFPKRKVAPVAPAAEADETATTADCPVPLTVRGRGDWGFRGWPRGGCRTPSGILSYTSAPPARKEEPPRRVLKAAPTTLRNIRRRSHGAWRSDDADNGLSSPPFTFPRWPILLTAGSACRIGTPASRNHSDTYPEFPSF